MAAICLARACNAPRPEESSAPACRQAHTRSRILLALLSCAALLAALLAPCPPRVGQREHAALAEHPPGCEMHESSPSLAAACPCGCAERAPMAGSSARLGVALPSAAPRCEPPSLAAHPPTAAPMLESSFVPAIDHVPLPV